MRHTPRPASTILRARSLAALLPLLASSVLVAATTVQRSPRGYFRAEPRANSDLVRVAFMNSPETDTQNGAVVADFARAELSGLGSERVQPEGAGPVSFSLKREAGTFTFDGKARSGVLDGTYTFTADRRFADSLVARGYDRPSDGEQFHLAATGVALELADELKAEGYMHPTTGDLVRMGAHGVDVAYVRSMASFADRLHTVTMLVRMRDHGVDLDYIAELERLGYANLSADMLTRLRDRGVDSAFVTGLARAGYERLTLKDLMTLKDHGITVSFAEQVRGGTTTGKLTADDLVRAKARGVS